MADLSDKNSAQTVKIVGADSSGVESEFLTSRDYASVRPLDVYLPQIGSSSVTHTRITLVANVSTTVASANSARKWLIIVNASGANIFMKFGVAAVVNQGKEISNNTDFSMSATLLYLGDVNVIVGSNNRTIEVIEAS